MEWADAEALEALAESDPPPTDTLEMFSHVLAAEHVWLARLRGAAPSVEVWPMLTLDGCARLAEENRRGWAEFMGALDAEGAERAVDYRNSNGAPFTSGADDISLHVMLNGA